MEPSSRRMIGRLIRLGLVVLAFVVVGSWLSSKLHRRSHGDLPSRIVKVDSLGPGDVRIVSTDSGVSITLQGDRLLAGLSPRTVARVRAELDSSAARDTGGLGGSIAQIVKKTVSENIDAQMAYSLSSVADMRFEDGYIVLVKTDGQEQRLFGSTKVGDEKPRFASEDAQRLITAFHQRRGLAP